MAHYAEASPLATGLACRCPRCGTGKLYDGLLRVAPRCGSCGLDLSAQDSGDGPAVFVIFVAGFLAVLLAYIVEMTFAPPAIVHLAYQIPFVTGISILLLRIFKAVLIAYQFKHKTPGFDAD